MKPWAVMCCGCFRFLGDEGILTKWRKRKRAKPESIQAWTAALKDAASFDTREEADAAARKAGWQTDDELGPGNHRCPECVANPRNKPAVPVRGAYVCIPEVLAGGNA